MTTRNPFPFAALGFVSYHGMNAEQFVWAWMKSEILYLKRMVFQTGNLYYEALKETIMQREKGGERQKKSVADSRL